LDEDYPDAKKVILICDNLNTHKPAALYKAFTPKEARRLLARKVRPKNSNWHPTSGTPSQSRDLKAPRLKKVSS
jgi:hypothetical protein